MRRSNSERSQTMRNALIEAARRLFVEKGYADTATPEIVAAAGVTRGALYHHFADKTALFSAVVEQESQALADAIEQGAIASNAPRTALLDGAKAYFDAMAVPGRTRLLLLEAPAVLGYAGARAIDADNAEAGLRAGIEALLAEHGKSVAQSAPLAELLSAAFDRASLAIDAGGDRAAYECAIATLIDGMVVR